MTTPFAKKLKAIRKAAGLNQEAFAKQIGVDQCTVSKWELGKQTPERDALLALSQFAGEDLLRFDPDAPVPEPQPAASSNGHGVAAPAANPKAASARLRQAFEVMFLDLVARLAENAEDREELADPAYRREVARVLALAATAPLNPDVILGDAEMARHVVDLWIHTLTHRESEQ